MSGGSVGKVAETISQSVAKPVIDEFKTDLEVVAQSVSANPLTTQQNPQQNQQNQQQTQNQQSQVKDQQEIQRIRNWIADLQTSQGKIRQEAKQKEILLKQQEEEEEEEKRKRVAEEEQRRQTIPSPAGPTKVPGIFTPRKKVREDIARTQPELRAGHGSGG